MHTLVLLTALLAPGQEPFETEPAVLVQAAKPKDNAETRKEARDAVLRSVGKNAIGMTRKYGDLGIACLQQCDPLTGKKLVALYNAGELNKLSNPRAVLEAIRQHGLAAGWFCEHVDLLIDPEALQCFCQSPMEYVYDLKSIEESAAELRASRKIAPAWLTTHTGEFPAAYAVMGGVIVILLGVIACKRRVGPTP